MSVKRIHREIADLKKPENHMGDITLEPTGDSLYVFKGKIPGPEGSVYEGGVYEVEIQLAPEYPCVQFSGHARQTRVSACRQFFCAKGYIQDEVCPNGCLTFSP